MLIRSTTGPFGYAKRAFGPFLAGALCLGLAACGSSSHSSGTASSAGSSATTGTSASSTVEWNASPAGYVAAGGTQLPDSYPTPTTAPKNCKIGYVSPTNAIPGIQTEIAGITEAATKVGCTVVAKDGQLNPQTQVTGVQSLLSEGVSALIINPLIIGALAAPIQQANAQHVPVIVVDSPADPNGAQVAGTISDFLQSRDVTAYAAAKAIADAHPGAQVGLLYPAFQAGNLQYQVERFQYWATKLGLQVVGQSDSSGDTPDADSKAVSALLQQHRSIQAVMTYNDTAAEAAASTARTLGMNNLLITGIDGEQGVTGLIAQGQVLMTWAYNNTLNGQEEGKAAIDAANGVTIPAKVSAPGAIINKANVSSYKPQA